NLLFDVNTAINNPAICDGGSGTRCYEVRRNGPTEMSVYVFGHLTNAGSGGTTTGGAILPNSWVEAWIDIVSNSSGTLGGFVVQTVRVSQPFADAAAGSAEVFVGQTSLYDGAMLLRGMSSESAATFAVSQTGICGGSSSCSSGLLVTPQAN